MCPDRPQDCPDSRHDRRNFLKATAAVSAALIAAPGLGADVASTPGDSAPMPQITLGKHSVSRLIVGCHNIDGGSQGKLDVVHDCLKRIRDAGLLVGVSTHMPEVVDAVESKGWDVDYFQTCVDQRHRDEATLLKLLGDVPPDEASLFGVQDPRRRATARRRAGVPRDVRRNQADRRGDRRNLRPLQRPGRPEHGPGSSLRRAGVGSIRVRL
jgi:hypothetical protein